jgi:multidrug efflux pump subunit AcrA (membrane-fusion protein)
MLVISFARERCRHRRPVAAALEAGFTRFRPVLMTALAMIIGMAPMALGMGEGGEQNAPLGRAVIGGLIFATVATLMFVPVSSGSWRASLRCWSWSPASARAKIRIASCANGPTTRPFRRWRWCCPDAKGLNATIDLPGRLEAYYRAPIFARVSGYLKGWSADIGAKVKAGQVIAEIEAPDLDQQLLQARADLASQQASAKLSEATLARRKTLIASNFVSMQEIDERTADLSNKNASVNVQPGQCRAAGGAGRLQEDHRAVRRRGHRPRHRRRRPDQCRRRQRPADVRDLRHQKLRVYVNVPQTTCPRSRSAPRP